MSFSLTLIADPASGALDHGIAMRVNAALEALTWDVLSENQAYHFEVEQVDPAQTTDVVRRIIEGRPIDSCLMPMTARRKRKILIADMDSTMIRQECIDELAAEAGLKERVSEITARAMNGELEFDSALKERVGLLAGLPSSVIDRVISTRIELMPGGPSLVSTMRRDGAWCALVSGGFTDFTARIAEMLGFHENRANRLLHSAGKLTGKVAEPILGKQAKVDALHDICQRLNLSVEDALAVGDGANDLGMLGEAGLGVALHAKPAVAAQADIRIDHGDLTALLFLQGYSRSEFAQ
ncbi:MAG: phosphoserine phosphatase SerB [Ahrensia sp.]